MGAAAAVPAFEPADEPDVAATDDDDEGRGADAAAPETLSQGFGGEAIGVDGQEQDKVFGAEADVGSKGD